MYQIGDRRVISVSLYRSITSIPVSSNSLENAVKTITSVAIIIIIFITANWNCHFLLQLVIFRFLVSTQ